MESAFCSFYFFPLFFFLVFSRRCLGFFCMENVCCVLFVVFQVSDTRGVPTGGCDKRWPLAGDPCPSRRRKCVWTWIGLDVLVYRQESSDFYV